MGPTRISKETLVSTLRWVADRIDENDSYEGNISYTFIGNRFDNLESGEVEVQGVLRYGNSEGQGFVTMFGELEDVPSE